MKKTIIRLEESSVVVKLKSLKRPSWVDWNRQDKPKEFPYNQEESQKTERLKKTDSQQKYLIAHICHVILLWRRFFAPVWSCRFGLVLHFSQKVTTYMKNSTKYLRKRLFYISFKNAWLKNSDVKSIKRFWTPIHAQEWFEMIWQIHDRGSDVWHGRKCQELMEWLQWDNLLLLSEPYRWQAFLEQIQ